MEYIFRLIFNIDYSTPHSSVTELQVISTVFNKVSAIQTRKQQNVKLINYSILPILPFSLEIAVNNIMIYCLIYELNNHNCKSNIIELCKKNLIPGLHIMWVEFVVGSCPFVREVFSRVLQFSLPLKNQHFQIPIWSIL